MLHTFEDISSQHENLRGVHRVHTQRCRVLEVVVNDTQRLRACENKHSVLSVFRMQVPGLSW